MAAAMQFKGERATTYGMQVYIACASMGEIVMAEAPLAWGLTSRRLLLLP